MGHGAGLDFCVHRAFLPEGEIGAMTEVAETRARFIAAQECQSCCLKSIVALGRASFWPTPSVAKQSTLGDFLEIAYSLE